MQHQLILVSAGESEWLSLNLFTGWSDVLLSERGRESAERAGHLLKKEGILLDRAYTSYLRRGIRTASLILQQMHQEYIPVIKAWQLNERHYGALQELSKID
ncbi:MAG: 2,3-bisphosphoglycerate-dependent phosphoglycerate mutase, partial [Lachnospiraceae bacterium]